MAYSCGYGKGPLIGISSVVRRVLVGKTVDYAHYAMSQPLGVYAGV